VNSMELFICNVPYSLSSDELFDVFARCGELLSARIITDRETGQSRGFGFVNFVNENDARRALAELDGFVVEERALRVRESVPHEQRSMAGQR